MFCTFEDHQRGWKEITVTYRDGHQETLRLKAPTRRQMRDARAELLKDADPWTIVKYALPAADETFMDRLDSASADLVESTAFALAFGFEWEKKMMAAVSLAAEQLATPTPPPSTNSAPNSPSSAPASPSTKPST